MDSMRHLKINIFILLSVLPFFCRGQIRDGVATYFDGIATPYGGCGVPEDRLETPYYVALDVYDSPGIGTMWPRPLTGANLAYMGEFQNGLNCGRWVRVVIEENCIGGINDGALGQPFCRNGGSWQDDIYSGAYMNLLVTDACGDNNAWCRDNRYHLDIRRIALDQFNINGNTTAGMVPVNWNNRQIRWEYIPAPNYQGDINIYMLQASQYYWPAITITNLPNGIHGVQQKINGDWVNLKMNSDMGQSYILQVTAEPYTIRVLDATDDFVQKGREYTFTNPCPIQPCQAVTTPVNYTTTDPIPLPVEFISLKTTFVGEINYLTWIVNYSEQGRFMIQGLNSEGRFENIHPVYAQNSPKQIYSVPLPEGYTFYRIQFEGENGQNIQSNIVHQSMIIRENIKVVSLSDGRFRIIGTPLTEFQMQLYSITGIFLGSIDSKDGTFDVPAQVSGLLLFSLVSDNQFFSGKLVVNK
jgi:hypothetical protein